MPKLETKLATVLEQVSTDEIWKAKDSARRIMAILKNPKYREAFLKFISDEDLDNLLKNPPLDLADRLEALETLELIPTHAIFIASMHDTAQEFRQRIESIRAETEEGKFDPSSSLLYKEIAYSKKIFEDGRSTLSYKDFSALQYLQDPNDRATVLATKSIQYDIGEAAIEAAAVFRHIESVLDGKPTLVIGNHRYGSNYVIDPLRPWLEKLPEVRVGVEYVQSIAYDSSRFSPIAKPQLSDTTTGFVVDNQPHNIVVVDGTNNSSIKHDSQEITRFPDAMSGYWLFCHESGLYNTHFWGPDITEIVSLRKKTYPRDIEKEGAQNSLHIVSASRWAPLDDAERLWQQEVPILTPHGYCLRQIALSEQAFVAKIQAGMQEKLTGVLGDV